MTGRGVGKERVMTTVCKPSFHFLNGGAVRAYNSLKVYTHKTGGLLSVLHKVSPRPTGVGT